MEYDLWRYSRMQARWLCRRYRSLDDAAFDHAYMRRNGIRVLRPRPAGAGVPPYYRAMACMMRLCRYVFGRGE